MGKLALVAILFGLFAACGNNGGGGGGDDDAMPPARCGDGVVDSNEQCDDGNNIANDGCTLCMLDTARMASIDAMWTLQTAAGDPAQCPSGFDTATVSAQPVDAQGNNAGTAVVDTFDCSAGMGTTKPMPATKYRATIAITNHDGTQTFATALAQDVDLGDATDKPLDVSFLTDGGKFQLAWQLVKMSDGTTPVDCATIGSQVNVRAAMTNTTTMMVKNSSFSCTTGAGITSAVVAGSYTVGIRLLKDFVTDVGDAPDLTAQVIMAPDGLTDLGTVKIPVTGL